MMKVLIILKRSPIQRYLVNLRAKALVEEVRDLINRQKHSQAIATAFVKGKIEREIPEYEVPHLDADLILSETTARWDLTAGK